MRHALGPPSRVIARMHEKKISQAQTARTLRRDRAGVPCSCTKSKQAFHHTPNPASRTNLHGQALGFNADGLADR